MSSSSGSNSGSLDDTAFASDASLRHQLATASSFVPWATKAVSASNVLRSSISSLSGLNSALIMSGFAAVGDLGAGALYSSTGATSDGLMAVQSADGVWFNLQISGPVSVGYFGAKGDGTTDDSAAFATALATGATIIIPAKQFLVTSTLSPLSNSQIIGYGDSSVILFHANAVAIHVVGKSSVLMRDFKILADRTTYKSVTNRGIFVDWIATAGNDVDIESVTVQACAGDAIIALASVGNASSRFNVKSCKVLGVGGKAIISQDYISDVKITTCYVNGCGLDLAEQPGITASRSGARVVITNNICIGSASALGSSVHGISCDTTTDVEVTGNVLSGWIGYGIEVGGVTNGTFTGNSIDRCGAAGIAFSGNEGQFSNINITVSGNVVTNGVNGNGIYSFITSGTGATMHKNVNLNGNVVVNQGGGAAIYMGLVDGMTISHNIATGSFQSGIYVLNCKGVTIGSNTVRKNNINGGVSGIKAITSVNRSGSTATVTLTAHGYTTGDVVNHFGISPNEFNIGAAITVTDVNNYTYFVSPSMLGTTGSGSSMSSAKAASLSHSGIYVNSTVFTGVETLFGFNLVEQNGYKQILSTASGPYGFINDWLVLREGFDAAQKELLTSGITANVRDRVGIGNKFGNLQLIYNDGTVEQLVNVALP